MKKIIIGSDHGGFVLKGIVCRYLKENGYEVEDAGTYSSDSCDYPVIAKQVAQKYQTALMKEEY